MVLWPLVSLVGFLAITGLVILLGMHSTARYERERRASSVGRSHRARHAAAEALGAAALL